MLGHRDVWNGIDRLAEQAGFSVSGLARRAGLDPTTFNKSKRISPQGKARWPSTESVAKVLDVTGKTLADFIRLIGPAAGAEQGRQYPVIGLAKAGLGGYFDDSGLPVGSGWDHVAGPDIGDDSAYALEITGDSMLPTFRPGDIVVVSPASPVRRGDRVVVRTTDGQVMAKVLIRQTAREIELQSINSDHRDPVVAAAELVWMHRIVWARQ
jgi:phage repressor protein C with HTH and peptisase S24 domain